MRTSFQTIALVSAVFAAGCSPTAEPAGGVDTPVGPTNSAVTPIPTTGGTPTTANTTGGVPTTANTTGGVPTTANTTGGVPSTTPSTGTTTGTTPSAEPPGPVTCPNPDKTTIAIEESAWVPKECNDFGIQGAWYCYDDGVNPSGCVADTPPWNAASSGMCLMGSTTVDETYAAWGAGIGFTLNATPTTDTEAGMKLAYDATANHVIGFKVVITGDTADLPLRISYKNQAEGDDPAPYLEVPGVGEYMVKFDLTAVPDWAETNPGEPPDPTQLYDIQIQVVGGDAAAAYSFCVTELTPITDGTAPEPSAMLANYGSVWTEQYRGVDVGGFTIANNRYGSNQHSLQALSDGGSKVGFVLSGLSANVETGNAPGSYPSIVLGWHVDGKFYGSYTTAKTIGSITSAPTSANVTVPGAPAAFNASYDLWISDQATPPENGPRTEMMIWLTALNTTPIGAKVANGVAIGGTNWTVWYDDEIGPDGFHTVSYIREQPATSDTLDIKNFLTDAVGRTNAEGDPYVQANQYLLGIQFGFEIWKGTASDVFKVNSYSAAIQ
jgi:xyloglucan-specific endo-beta-1,4-glucanase